MNKLGIYFGTEKRDALFRGDTSNAVVNRYFMYGFQTIGTHFCKTLDESPAMIQLVARYAQKAWETLAEIYGSDDQKLKVQGLLLFLHFLIVAGFPASAKFYLLKACELINSGKLQFLPTYGRPPELSEEVREDAAVLSQAIYMENYIYLALDGPPPVKTARIELEFRQDFQVRTIRYSARSGLRNLVQRVYPPLFNVCPLTIRTQSILLVRDATLALDSHPAGCKADSDVPP